MQQLEERVIRSVSQPGWMDDLAQGLQDVLHNVFRNSEFGRRAKDFLNGVWMAHPMHPAATDVPVGAWTTAFILDGVESATGRNMEGAASTAIGFGIAGALVSAASGAADWSDTYGDQRRVGLVHALLNTVALSLYSASLWRRLTGQRSGAKVLSSAGFLTMVAGAYLGGELVFRLGTQVDRNAYARAIQEYTPVMREADLPSDKPTRTQLQGVPLLLVRQGTEIYALSDRCSHQGCSLSGGRLEDGSIVCPCHGSTFRLGDGSVIHGPSPYAQPRFETRVRDGQIEVRSAQP